MSADNYVYVGRNGKRWFVEDRFASCEYSDLPDGKAAQYDSYEEALEAGAERVQAGYYEYGLRTAPPIEAAPPKPRLETGVVQVGDDWPGIFLRGDDAMGFAMSLEALLADSDQTGPTVAVVHKLRRLLFSCHARFGDKPVSIRHG